MFLVTETEEDRTEAIRMMVQVNEDARMVMYLRKTCQESEREVESAGKM